VNGRHRCGLSPRDFTSVPPAEDVDHHTEEPAHQLGLVDQQAAALPRQREHPLVVRHPRQHLLQPGVGDDLHPPAPVSQLSQVSHAKACRPRWRRAAWRPSRSAPRSRGRGPTAGVRRGVLRRGRTPTRDRLAQPGQKHHDNGHLWQGDPLRDPSLRPSSNPRSSAGRSGSPVEVKRSRHVPRTTAIRGNAATTIPPQPAQGQRDFTARRSRAYRRYRSRWRS
jgi:hypothetical protein